ncbi:MAG: phosphopantetheine-binding protein [Desulfarculales bacterium]|jgi:acyl carrier protein|nr:phosphopantetheine-binding protein [Desulfarculales bacterium]
MNHSDDQVIIEGVLDALLEVLEKDALSIHPHDRVIDDLGLDSLDLLSLVFQLEIKFGIKISLREMEKQAQKELGGIPLEEEGIFSEEGLLKLRAAMPEVPAAEFKSGLSTSELPRLFRVQTFVNLVKHAQNRSGQQETAD